MEHDGCVFVVGIHPSKTSMLGSFESVRWTAYVHRLDLALYSHPKEFWGNGVGTHVNPKGKILYRRLGGGSNPRNAFHRMASPTHYRLSYSGP